MQMTRKQAVTLCVDSVSQEDVRNSSITATRTVEQSTGAPDARRPAAAAPRAETAQSGPPARPPVVIQRKLNHHEAKIDVRKGTTIAGRAATSAQSQYVSRTLFLSIERLRRIRELG